MNDLDYIGRATCGCVKIWILGSGQAAQDKRKLAKDIARIVRAGLSLERATTEAARQSRMHCEVCRPVKQGVL